MRATYFIAFVLFLCLVFAGISKLFNDGSGIDDVRKQYDAVTEHQRRVTRGIDDAAQAAQSISKGAEGVAGTISDARGTTERLAAGERNAAEIIAECQSIIAGIRKRGTAETTAH